MSRRWPKYAQHLKTGDWQLHTTQTDGTSTIEENFRQAEENGLTFLHFSEHVRRNLDYDYLKFKEEVYKIGSKFKIGFCVGAETKVLDTAGNFDIGDEVIREAELVTFSFHSKYFLTKEDYVKAIVSSTENQLADIWGHPTSYHNWLGFTLDAADWKVISSALKANNVIYELNKRYEKPGKTEMSAIVDGNVQIAYSSDAHHVKDLLQHGDHNTFTTLINDNGH